MTLISFWVTFTSTVLNEPGSMNIKILCAVSELFNKQLDSLNLQELQHYNILMEYIRVARSALQQWLIVFLCAQ